MKKSKPKTIKLLNTLLTLSNPFSPNFVVNGLKRCGHKDTQHNDNQYDNNQYNDNQLDDT
jgi:hypothetical protein